MSNYMERAFYNGEPCHHIGAWEEQGLAERRKRNAVDYKGRNRRRFNPATLEAGQNVVHAMQAHILRSVA